MKLWSVELTYNLVVRAPSEREAVQVAGDTVRGLEFDQEADYWNASIIRDLSDLPSGWDGDCRPWGERDGFDRTIKEQLQPAPGEEVCW